MQRILIFELDSFSVEIVAFNLSLRHFRPQHSVYSIKTLCLIRCIKITVLISPIHFPDETADFNDFSCSPNSSLHAKNWMFPISCSVHFHIRLCDLFCAHYSSPDRKIARILFHIKNERTTKPLGR